MIFYDTIPGDSAIPEGSTIYQKVKVTNFVPTIFIMRRILNIGLWTAQVLLSATFVWAAATKLFTPSEKLAAVWPWTAAHTQLLWITAILDLLAGLGILLPSLLRIKPKMLVYTSYAVIALMTAATFFHFFRSEAAPTGINLFIAVMAAFIAWGRNKNGNQE